MSHSLLAWHDEITYANPAHQDLSSRQCDSKDDARPYQSGYAGAKAVRQLLSCIWGHTHVFGQCMLAHAIQQTIRHLLCLCTLLRRDLHQ